MEPLTYVIDPPPGKWGGLELCSYCYRPEKVYAKYEIGTPWRGDGFTESRTRNVWRFCQNCLERFIHDRPPAIPPEVMELMKEINQSKLSIYDVKRVLSK